MERSTKLLVVGVKGLEAKISADKTNEFEAEAEVALAAMKQKAWL